MKLTTDKLRQTAWQPCPSSAALSQNPEVSSFNVFLDYCEILKPSGRGWAPLGFTITSNTPLTHSFTPPGTLLTVQKLLTSTRSHIQLKHKCLSSNQSF